MKLLVGIILCILAIIGIGISIYAWKMTAEARDNFNESDDKLEELRLEDPEPLDYAVKEAILVEEKKEADDNWERNERSAGLASVVSIIFAILGMLLIVLDVLKVKDPGEEEETPPEKEEKPSTEEY